jgi:deoxyribonuclease V
MGERGGGAGGLRPVIPCRFDLAPADAAREQERLQPLVRLGKLATRGVRLVAGCDCAIAGDRICAAVLVLELPGLAVIDAAEAVVPMTFPYVPGLLSFRELPALLAAFAQLQARPDAVLCDGQGIAHPRRFGLACHLGLLLDLPTVGCAKSRLIGKHGEPGPRRGDRTPLRDGCQVIGTVLRTRDRVRPLYISPGHRATLRDAAALVLLCGAGYRLPEPTRRADAAVGRLARSLSPRAGP